MSYRRKIFYWGFLALMPGCLIVSATPRIADLETEIDTIINGNQVGDQGANNPQTNRLLTEILTPKDPKQEQTSATKKPNDSMIEKGVNMVTDLYKQVEEKAKETAKKTANWVQTMHWFQKMKNSLKKMPKRIPGDSGLFEGNNSSTKNSNAQTDVNGDINT